MKIKLVANTGPVDVDVDNLNMVKEIICTDEIDPAKPLVSVDATPEGNEGGKSDFVSITASEFFKQTALPQ